MIITLRACVFSLRFRITSHDTEATANTSARSFASSCLVTVNEVLLSNSCHRLGARSEIPDGSFMSLGNQESLMTGARTHWCLLTFRCVECGRNEAFAEDSFQSEPREDQIRPRYTKLFADIAVGRVRFVVSPPWKCAAESNAEREFATRNEIGPRRTTRGSVRQSPTRTLPVGADLIVYSSVCR